jgi:hypothetical protein
MQRLRRCLLPLALAIATLSGAADAAGRSSPSQPVDASPVAQGDTQTYIFRDILKPHGKARSADERHADGRACGASADLTVPSDTAAFNRCMSSRGWRLDHIAKTYAPEPFVPEGADGTYTYNDILKPHGRERGEPQEQADTRACDAGDSDNIGSEHFRACMHGRGWRLTQFDPAPASPDDSSPADETPAYDGTADTLQFVQQQQAIEQANDAAQAQANAALAAMSQP